MILVTGANGYIGEAVLLAAAAAGVETTALARHDTFDAAQSFIPYDLNGALPAGLTDGATVIHLAYHPKADNLAATQRWIDYVQAKGGRLIFVSSQTARADAPTLYGYDKWRIERRVLNADQTVVRPGMVHGGREAGLYGLISRAIRWLPLLPDFRPAPQVQPIHVDDLAAALVKIATEEPDGEYNLGYETPIGFTAFLRQLATDAGLRRFYLPFPVRWLNGLLVLVEKNFVPDAIRHKAQSLKSLFDLPPMPVNNVLPLRAFFSRETDASRNAKKIFRSACGTTKPEWVSRYLELGPAGPRRTQQLAALAIAQQDPRATHLFHDQTRADRLKSLIALPFVLLEELRQRILDKVLRRG